MRGVVLNGSVVHSARTVGGGAGSRVPATEAAAAAHVPAAQERAVHTLPFRRVVAGRDGTAEIAACNVARYSES